ncbi:hypothetical protein L2E82_26383 [Cichorium intybus]|uniref:Uncharacterized protein n=1 Tax=Cichorium intybus TaxID=13427 RepID=A0ACB9CR43_CICIN|nr:hypothetical protein L2E82_26383 [Cichorium intybus]
MSRQPSDTGGTTNELTIFYDLSLDSSKNLGSLWDDLGKTIEGEDEIEVGEVDCGTNKPLCSKVKIGSYPSFKLFYNGEEVADIEFKDMHMSFVIVHSTKSGRLRSDNVDAVGRLSILNESYYRDTLLKISGIIDDLQWSADGMRIVASGDGKDKSFVRAFVVYCGKQIKEEIQGVSDLNQRNALQFSFIATLWILLAAFVEEDSGRKRGEIKVKIFSKAVEINNGGDANIKYAWFGASKDEINKIILHGFNHENIQKNSSFGQGVVLSPDHSPLAWFLLPTSLIVINDITAYIFGFFFGKTPLIKLSPKKTWEGFIGASVATIISAFLLANVFERIIYLGLLVIAMRFLTVKLHEMKSLTENRGKREVPSGSSNLNEIPAFAIKG